MEYDDFEEEAEQAALEAMREQDERELPALLCCLYFSV